MYAGLWTKNGEQILPSFISINAKVVDLAAQIVFKKTYSEINKYFPDSQADEGTFKAFLNTSLGVLCGFEINLDGKKIKSKVISQQEAMSLFEKNQQLANVVKEAEIGGSSVAANQDPYIEEDIFLCKLNNLSSYKELEIVITYATEMSTQGDLFYLEFPASLSTARPSATFESIQEAEKKTNLASSKDSVPVVHSKQGIFIELNLEMPSPISEITSPTHPQAISVNYAAQNGRVVYKDLRSMEDVINQNDLVIMIKLENPHEPYGFIEENTDGSKALMIAFYPQLENNTTSTTSPTISNTSSSSSSTKEVELIFLIDTSESMDTYSISHSKKALNYFIHSLTKDQYFNIISFGSKFNKLFETSQKYDKDSLAAATQYVKTLKTDSGETNLLAPLQDIYSQSTTRPRKIFLLTDGRVSSVGPIVELVRQHSHNTSVFPIGMGDFVSRQLVYLVANAGSGVAELAIENETIESKVMRQLKRALQPAMSNIKIEWGTLSNKNQAPRDLSTLFLGDRLTIYNILEKDEKIDNTVKLTAIGPNGPVSFPVTIKQEEIKQGNIVHNLAAYTLISDLQDQIEETTDAKVIDQIRQKIISLGIKYGLASYYTSFFSVEEEDTPTPSTNASATSIQLNGSSSSVETPSSASTPNQTPTKSTQTTPVQKESPTGKFVPPPIESAMISLRGSASGIPTNVNHATHSHSLQNNSLAGHTLNSTSAPFVPSSLTGPSTGSSSTPLKLNPFAKYNLRMDSPEFVPKSFVPNGSTSSAIPFQLPQGSPMKPAAATTTPTASVTPVKPQPTAQPVVESKPTISPTKTTPTTAATASTSTPTTAASTTSTPTKSAEAPKLTAAALIMQATAAAAAAKDQPKPVEAVKPAATPVKPVDTKPAVENVTPVKSTPVPETPKSETKPVEQAKQPEKESATPSKPAQPTFAEMLLAQQAQQAQQQQAATVPAVATPTKAEPVVKQEAKPVEAKPVEPVVKPAVEPVVKQEAKPVEPTPAKTEPPKAESKPEPSVSKPQAQVSKPESTVVAKPTAVSKPTENPTKPSTASIASIMQSFNFQTHQTQAVPKEQAKTPVVEKESVAVEAQPQPMKEVQPVVAEKKPTVTNILNIQPTAAVAAASKRVYDYEKLLSLRYIPQSVPVPDQLRDSPIYKNNSQSNKGHFGKKKRDKGQFGFNSNQSSTPTTVPKKLYSKDTDGTHSEILKKFKINLNRITMDTYPTIVKNIEEIKIPDDECLQGICTILFEKAVIDQKYSAVYAILSSHLNNFFKLEKTSVRACILNNCRQVMLSKLDKERLDTLSKEDREEEEFIYKRRILGNYKFIGELYKQNELAEKIAKSMISGLIETVQKTLTEESIESISKLITTLGKKLDESDKKSVDEYFKQLTDLTEVEGVTSRGRYLLLNLIDLRAAKWQVKSTSITKAAKEENEKEEKFIAKHGGRRSLSSSTSGSDDLRRSSDSRSTPSRGKGGLFGNSGGDRGGKSSSSSKNDGWETVGGGKGGKGGKGSKTPTKGGKNDSFSLFGGGKGSPRNQKDQRDQEKPGSKPSKDEFSSPAKGNMFSALRMDDEYQAPSSPKKEKFTPSRVQPEPVKETKPQPKEEPVVEKPASSTEEDLEKIEDTISITLDEYLETSDIDEAIECIKELEYPALHSKIFGTIVTKSLEKRDKEKQAILELLKGVFEAQLFTGENVKDALKDTVESIEDIEVDLPFASKFVASVIGLCIEMEVLPLTYICESYLHLADTGKAEEMLIETLKAVIAQSEQDRLVELYEKEENLNLLPLFRLKNQNLTYLTEFFETHFPFLSAPGAEKAAKSPEAELDDAIDQLLILQSADGYWEITKKLANIINVPFSDVTKAESSDSIQVSHPLIWATCLAFSYLQIKSQEESENLEMVIEKTRNWLKSEFESNSPPKESLEELLMKSKRLISEFD